MNFKQLIDDLISSGVSEITIARQAGVTRAAISQARSGDRKNLRFRTGINLIRFYNSKFPERAIDPLKAPASLR